MSTLFNKLIYEGKTNKTYKLVKIKDARCQRVIMDEVASDDLSRNAFRSMINNSDKYTWKIQRTQFGGLSLEVLRKEGKTCSYSGPVSEEVAKKLIGK